MRFISKSQASLMILDFRFKKTILSVVFIFVFLLTTYYSLHTTLAEPNCDKPGPGDFDFCIQKIQGEIDALKPAHEYNKQELSNLKNQVTKLTKQIAAISESLDDLSDNIQEREKEAAFTKEIFKEKANNHYKFLRLYDPLVPFLSSSDATTAFREINFRKRASDSDRQAMEALAIQIASLESDKVTLEKSKTGLASAKSQVSSRASFLEGEVNKVEAYLTELSSKQKELVALKEGGFQTSIGDTPPTMVPCSGPSGSSSFCDPGFRPAFAGFSFGAPHRTGMSQYGAYGRSKAGQSVDSILSAYYQGAELNKSYSATSTITVQGIGTVSLEDNYLLGIYEVPESWGDNGGFEALKAQAVAARSYALHYTGNGARSICTTESCQVYKPQLKSGKWAEAVRATRGWVLTKGGSPAPTYYASTSGGYTLSNWGWNGIKDTSGDWPGGAYEKAAGSPWFYMGWYKTRGGGSCGRSNPWLTEAEMADILNAWQVLYQGGGDVSRISPVTTSCWGGNPYSVGELASIGGFSSVSSITATYSNSGNTSSVTIATNKGTITIAGSEFKKAFNLRAPGYLGLKSDLFNIEKI